MTHITCRLTAKNRDQLRNPTLGNRVWGLPLPFLARLAVPLAACVCLHVTGVRCTDDIAAVNPRLRVIRDK